ncbi:hypothetical protein PQX77_021146 [Marasmius sp. AFHP31]|nr:hypothetical protein PQX77_021146 [Marasmius sp. AFHP31]
MSASSPPVTPNRRKGTVLPSSTGRRRTKERVEHSSTHRVTTTTTTMTVVETPTRRRGRRSPIIISSDEESDHPSSPATTLDDKQHSPPCSPSIPPSSPSSLSASSSASLSNTGYYSTRYPTVPIPTPEELREHRFEAPMYYTVTAGTSVGIFSSWLQVAPLTVGYRRSQQKKYPTFEEAWMAYSEAYNNHRVMVVDKGGDLARTENSSSPVSTQTRGPDSSVEMENVDAAENRWVPVSGWQDTHKTPSPCSSDMEVAWEGEEGRKAEAGMAWGLGFPWRGGYRSTSHQVLKYIRRDFRDLGWTWSGTPGRDTSLDDLADRKWVAAQIFRCLPLARKHKTPPPTFTGPQVQERISLIESDLVKVLEKRDIQKLEIHRLERRRVELEGLLATVKNELSELRELSYSCEDHENELKKSLEDLNDLELIALAWREGDGVQAGSSSTLL